MAMGADMGDQWTDNRRRQPTLGESLRFLAEARRKLADWEMASLRGSQNELRQTDEFTGMNQPEGRPGAVRIRPVFVLEGRPLPTLHAEAAAPLRLNLRANS